MDYSIKPEEHQLREARQVVKGTIESSRFVMPKEESLKINLGWTQDDFVNDKMGGTTGLTYSYEKFEIEFNSDTANWKRSLEATTAHEYAHTWFYEKLGNKEYGDIQFIWQHLLMEAHAKIFSERITDTKSQMAKALDEDELTEIWPDLKEKLEDGQESHGEFFTGQGELPMWAGYALAYKIGQKLLENYELEDFPELKRSDIVKAGENLYE